MIANVRFIKLVTRPIDSVELVKCSYKKFKI